LDAVFTAFDDFVQSGSISRGGHTHSGSTDGQASSNSGSTRTGLGKLLADGLRQLLTKAPSGRIPNSCSSLAHAAAGGAGVVDVRDLPALLSLLLTGLAHKEVAELAAWLRAGSQQQQAQGMQGITLQELEASIRGLLEASE
jgi:hypothetical protein